MKQGQRNIAGVCQGDRESQNEMGIIKGYSPRFNMVSQTSAEAPYSRAASACVIMTLSVFAFLNTLQNKKNKIAIPKQRNIPKSPTPTHSLK